MAVWRRLEASWTFYWTATGAILASAPAVGLATAAGRLQAAVGLSTAATLLFAGVAACQPLPDRWL